MRTIYQVHLRWAVAGLVGLALITTEARGQDDFFWTNMLGGAYNGAGNWAPAGPPEVADIANFDVGATYVVDVTENASAARINVSDGDVTFNMMGSEYVISAIGANFNLANQDGQNHSAIFRLTGGGEFTVQGPLLIGRYAGSDGRLYVDNGSVFNQLIENNNANFELGRDDGHAELHVSDGGVFNAQRRINLISPSTLVTVAGTNSAIIAAQGILTEGNNNSVSWNIQAGTLIVSDGGLAAARSVGQNDGHDNPELMIGSLAGSTGTVVVTGSGSRLLSPNANTRGMSVGRREGRTGSLTILDGGRVDAHRLGIGRDATLAWDVQTDVGEGIVTVSGQDSRAVINQRLSVFGGSTLVIADGGRVTTETLLLRGDGEAVNPRLAELDITLGAHNYIIIDVDDEVRFYEDTELTLRVDGNFSFSDGDVYRVVRFESLGDDEADGYGKLLGGYAEGATILDDSGSYAFRLSYGDDLAGHVTLTATEDLRPALSSFSVGPETPAAVTLSSSVFGTFYALEYTEDLTETPVVWLPAVTEPGTGGTITLEDDGAPGAIRIYRVRIE